MRVSRCTARGADVRVFTRNLNDVTDRLPEVVEVVRAFPAESFVLDGETIGIDDDERPHTFQDTMSRFGRDDAGTHAMVMSGFFFDVLHVDGIDVMERPLAERAAALERLVGELSRPVHRDRRRRCRARRSSTMHSPPATRA